MRSCSSPSCCAAAPDAGALVADDMGRNLASVGPRAVFEKIDPLPGAKGHAAVPDRYDKLGVGECRADMGGHVVGPLGIMAVARALGRDAAEKILKIGEDVRIRILLDQQ